MTDQALIDELVGNAHGNMARVQEILTAHPELVNAASRWGETPVQAAAQMGDRAMTEYLLGLGAPLDICTAAMLGRGDIVEVMLATDPAQAHANRRARSAGAVFSCVARRAGSCRKPVGSRRRCQRRRRNGDSAARRSHLQPAGSGPLAAGSWRRPLGDQHERPNPAGSRSGKGTGADDRAAGLTPTHICRIAASRL